MKSNNNGITLIALVITIIVMLILVSVTISMAINGGLFEYAGRAVSETENAIDREQILANGGIVVNGVQYNSIDDFLDNKPAAVHNWTRNGDTFTCSHCNATYTMGDVVNYTPKGNTSAIITAEMSGIQVIPNPISFSLTDGTNKATTTEMKKENNANINLLSMGLFGQVRQDEEGNQTIYVDAFATWIVLGIEDTNKDGKYETLLITTQAPVGIDEKIYLHGAEAYNNGPSEINRICEELYSNSEYGKARGMTIEDVNNALNVDLEEFGLGGMYTDDGSTWKTTGNLTTKLNGRKTDGSIEIDLQTLYNSYVANERTQTPDGRALEEYELNGYMYGINDDGTALINPANGETHNITEVERNVIFGDSGDYLYWLASRGVNAYSDCAGFGPGGVGYGDARSCRYTFISIGDEINYNAALRPVVSLKSKLPAIVEDETQSPS